MPRLAWRPDVFATDRARASGAVAIDVAARIGDQELGGHRNAAQQMALAIELEDRRDHTRRK